MTGANIPAALARIGWSRRELARRTGYDESTIRGWISGAQAAPTDVLSWLDDLAAYHLTHRPPIDPRLAAALAAIEGGAHG